MKLVEFSNGNYGVRGYWLFGWSFYDLKSHGFLWRRRSRFFIDCQGTREEAEDFIRRNQLPKYKFVN